MKNERVLLRGDSWAHLPYPMTDGLPSINNDHEPWLVGTKVLVMHPKPAAPVGG